MVTGTHRGVWEQQVGCWLEPRCVGRATMGDEAGKRVGIRIMEGPKCQVRSLDFLLQTAGSLLP